MKRTLLKLIEYSILPAILLFLGKLLGLILIGSLFSIPIDINAPDKQLLLFSTSVDQDSIETVSTYSDLFMFVIISIAMTFVLIQAIYFHNSHISSKTISRLAKYNLLGLIRSSFQLYHAGVVWLGFLWISAVVIFINYYQSITELWVLLISLLFCISFSIIFIRDLFLEIGLVKENYA